MGTEGDGDIECEEVYVVVEGLSVIRVATRAVLGY
jgi:hypothetical protein